MCLESQTAQAFEARCLLILYRRRFSELARYSMTPRTIDRHRVHQPNSLQSVLFGVGYQGQLLSSGVAFWGLCVYHKV